MQKSSYGHVSLLEAPCLIDSRGTLTIYEGPYDLPFQVKRIYILHSLPHNSVRGGHAHRNLFQILIAASGSFTVTTDNGLERSSWTLASPKHGLLITPGVWREIRDFSPNSSCVVLASELYDESDYIRDYSQFRSSVS